MNQNKKDFEKLWKDATSIDTGSFIQVKDAFQKSYSPVTGYGFNSGTDDPNLEPESGTSFAITINGLEPGEDSSGLPIPATSFTLDCIGGNAKYPTDDIDIVSPSGVSATFPTGNGKKFYRVYAQVAFSRSASNKPLDTIITSETKIVIEETSNASFGINSAWRKKSDGYYYHYLPIGTVAAVKSGLERSAFVNQIQVGDYIYSDGSDGTESSDSNGVDTRDGLRTVILCVNGIPYNIDIDVTNMSAV